MLRWIAIVIAAFAALPVLAPLAAHELRPSVVELREVEAGQYRMDWKVTLAMGGGAALVNRLQPVIPRNCIFVGNLDQRIQSATLMGQVRVSCDGAPTDGAFGLSELLGKSDAIARFVPRDAPAQSFRLTADQPIAIILAEPDVLSVLIDYFVIGAQHILLGWDHLLFVIALVLLVRAPWPVVKATTAFTVAHSITLVATVLGYSGLPNRPVEALIALSIVFLAVEVAILSRDPDRRTLTRQYPWAVAFAFGLVHGFGFAGALSEIGLPQTQVVTALFAFNIGVEAGQLLVVLIAVLFLKALANAAIETHDCILKIVNYAIGSIGSFWLIERLIG